MKSNIILFTLLALVSCGKRTVYNYIENPFDNSGNESRLSDLERRVNELELNLSSYTSELQGIANSIGELDNVSYELNQRINLLDEAIDQTIIELAIVKGHSIEQLVDPCGKQGVYDEVLIKTGDNKVIAYFEQGNKRSLIVLPAGNYKTKDGTNCHFSVDNEGNIID